MKILYIIYQVCFALPILLVLTILTALVTIIGSLIGGAHIWGYYPGKIWSQLICYILLIPVEVHGKGENTQTYFLRVCAQSPRRLRHIPDIRIPGTELQMDDEEEPAQNPVCRQGMRRAQDISSSTVPAPRRCLPPCGRQNHL